MSRWKSTLDENIEERHFKPLIKKHLLTKAWQCLPASPNTGEVEALVPQLHRKVMVPKSSNNTSVLLVHLLLSLL